jgi:hypothetical protein
MGRWSGWFPGEGSSWFGLTLGRSQVEEDSSGRSATRAVWDHDPVLLFHTQGFFEQGEGLGTTQDLDNPFDLGACPDHGFSQAIGDHGGDHRGSGSVLLVALAICTFGGGLRGSW